MAELLRFLKERNSCARLEEPAPDEAALEEMLRVGLRAPDHGRLCPWRFISVRGPRRAALGALLERSLIQREPEADERSRNRAREAPLRAPLIVVVVAAISEHPKVPVVEQRMSAACAAYGVLLAAEALGYAGIWRTGPAAFDRELMIGLGLAAHEEITAFLYLGSRGGSCKTLPSLEVQDFHSEW